ncbi:MAG: metal ABC transporter ATP-binding protein [Paracoccaceae bacterium]
MSLITAENISVSYGANMVLRDVSLAVAQGEIVTIVGPNGSGKTTLLRLLIGAERPTAGRITQKPGLRIGYVPQKLHIDPTLPITVDRFLRLPRGNTRLACATALEQAGVPDLSNRQMSALSGGQLQRVLLARALINQPELLLLDEATQGLDQPGSAAFYLQIAELRHKTGCAILMISHELHVVMAASDRVICLNGHVCCEGSPEIVSAAPEYRAIFGTGTGGALALYRHEHDHSHDETCENGDAHDHAPHTKHAPHKKTEAAE